MGAPHDLYDVSDFEAVRGKYKAVVFLSDLKTEAMRRALDLCRRERIRYISLSALKKSFSTKELRAFCKANGIHVYCETDNLVYVGGNYLAVHAAETGDAPAAAGVRLARAAHGYGNRPDRRGRYDDDPHDGERDEAVPAGTRGKPCTRILTNKPLYYLCCCAKTIILAKRDPLCFNTFIRFSHEKQRRTL